MFILILLLLFLFVSCKFTYRFICIPLEINKYSFKMHIKVQYLLPP